MMMTAESMLLKRPVLRITVTLNLQNFSECVCVEGGGRNCDNESLELVTVLRVQLS